MSALVRRDFVLTSSSLEQFETCPASALYVIDQKPKVNFGQWYGIFVHRFLEYFQTRGYDAALAYIRSKKLKGAVNCCERIDPQQLYLGHAEVGMTHDPFDDAGRKVSLSLYDTIDWRREQFGKADLIVEVDVPKPMIADYKCGGFSGNPSDSTQLLGLAASYRAITGVHEIDLGGAGVMSNGDIHWIIQSVDKGDLDRYVERARRVHVRVLNDRKRVDEGATPEFVKSEKHCKWCHLRPACPAWK